MSNNTRQCTGNDFTHFDSLFKLGFQDLSSSFLHFKWSSWFFHWWSLSVPISSQRFPFSLSCLCMCKWFSKHSFLNKAEMCSVREKHTWPCLCKQLLSQWICACPNYIVCQPWILCPIVLWHRRSLCVAFSISVVIFLKYRRLLCFTSPPLVAKVHCYSSAVKLTSYWRLQIFRGIRCYHFFLMDRKLSTRFQSVWIFMDLSANRKWQAWQSSECGQLSREPNVTPDYVKSFFLL